MSADGIRPKLGGLDGSAVDAADRIVLVHDRGPRFPATLDDALASRGLKARRLSDPASLAHLRPDDDCGFALVGAGEEPDASVLDCVGVLKRKGYTVLCYRSGAGSWALGAQCRLLLAGASELLDGSDAALGPDLCGRLARLLDAEAERRREGRKTRGQMAALGVVGSSPAISGVFRWVQRVAPLSDLPVLVSGETGTGKELVARAIHRLDPRRSAGPLIPVNCSAISPGLAESELFGHRRGAFTGAEQARKGLVRAASGGVLFLDEIGDLDASLQGKLLRMLQERRVLSLGHDEETPVDVRIVAATHRDLEAMVREGTFRADLFHRLNVLSTRLPALRERPEDVEPLVRHFMARCAGVPENAVSVSQAFVLALQRVELPGNVRQLDNLVRRAMVSWRPGDPLRLSDLPPELWLQLAHLARRPGAEADRGAGQALLSGEALPAAAPPALLDAVGVLAACSWQLGRALDLCERKIVDAALGASNGNRSRAARLLGISPRSIFNKLRKHHLNV